MNQTKLLGEHHERVAITKLRLGSLANHTLTTSTGHDIGPLPRPIGAEARCQAETLAVGSVAELVRVQLCVAFAVQNELNLASSFGSP